MTSVSEGDLLDRPVYTMQQVDSILGISSGTTHRWLEGYERGGHFYPPVVRSEPSGSEIVTWGEFVETRLLALYRHARDMPMQRMRPAVEQLRQEFGVKYPLAELRPYIRQRELVYYLQQQLGTEKELLLVVARNHQYVLADPAQQFVESTEFEESENGIALRIRPLGLDQPVVLDPLRNFGQPAIRSVPTEVLAELFRAGDPVEMLAELYELPALDVQAALRFELGRGAAAA